MSSLLVVRVHQVEPAFNWRLRVDVLVHIEAMTELIGDQFAIDAESLDEFDGIAGWLFLADDHAPAI